MPPPVQTPFSSYKTIDCPGVIAFCLDLNLMRYESLSSEKTLHSLSLSLYLTFA